MPDLKQINADNWGRTSEQYAERAHKGSGMMMPLIRNYTQVKGMTASLTPLAMRPNLPACVSVRA